MKTDNLDICDSCGEKVNKEKTTTITTKNLSGIVMCEDCLLIETAQKIIEQHKETFRKLAEYKEE